ncbi:DUF7674 family protein [Burkholderia gladioli]|uniref:DUF7674 family protein n=1 Tax=Burkholderia gladioli TaxID=28095 RepID=UPI00163EF00E|nr:hypothetical protein [Burkholderia gladioli]
MKVWRDFVDEFMRVDFLKSTINEFFDDWGEGGPMTVLFSSMGKRIVSQFNDCRDDDLILIFNSIELAMIEGDAALKSLVATGILEAIYSKAHDDVLLWRRINGWLGQESRRYLVEWGRWAQQERD